MVESLFKGTVNREEAMIVEEACIRLCDISSSSSSSGCAFEEESASGGVNWLLELLEAFEPLEFMLVVLLVVKDSASPCWESNRDASSGGSLENLAEEGVAVSSVLDGNPYGPNCAESDECGD